MDERLAERLEEARAALADVESRLVDPDIDPAEYADLGRRHASLRVVVELHQAWTRADTDRREARELAEADPDMATELTALAEERARECARLEGEIRRELVPKDPDDERDAILEIRAAAGGSEAAIWAGDLARMYERYAERHDLTVEWLETSEGDAGGFSKATFAVKGRGAYGLTRHEAGVHRVQRVPKTESQGRIHTSTATVAVLPEVDQVEMEVDPNDVRVDVFRSSGPGGQSVNTTDSAVRLTHVPTGTVVSCQDEKSQLQNKEKAFRILRARLYRMEEERRRAELAGVRRTQVGAGARSEKIRTYNFKENRVTDHRLERTVYRLDQVLDGDLDELVQAMMETEAAEALSSGS